MLKKKILLVVHDDMGAMALLNKDFINSIKSEEIYISSPYNSDVRFKNYIEGMFDSVRYDGNFHYRYCFGTRALYKLLLILNYLLHYKWESTYQKVLEILGFGNTIYKSTLVTRQLFQWLSIISFPANYLLSTVIRKILIGVKPLERQRNGSFNLIFLSRPDGLTNLYYFRKACHDKTEIGIFIRNWDTLFLKGGTLFKAGFTIANKLVYYIKKDIYRELYGDIIECNPCLVNKDRLELNKDKGDNKYIVYATIQHKFNPCQVEIVNKLYDCFINNSKIKFGVKLHPTDNINYYTNIGSSGLYDSANYLMYNNRTFADDNYTIQYYNYLNSCDVIISSGSTINYDALNFNKISIFLFAHDTVQKTIKKREHIQLGIKYGIHDVSIEDLLNIEQLDTNKSKFIENSMGEKYLYEVIYNKLYYE